MKPTPSTMPRTGAPLTRIAPPLGRSRPDTIDSIVDLPHPVGPTTAQNWPAPTDMVTSEIAVKTVPVGDRNRLVTDASSTLTCPGGPPRASSRRALSVGIAIYSPHQRRLFIR